MMVAGENTRGGHKPMEQNIGKGELHPLTYFNIDILTHASKGYRRRIYWSFGGFLPNDNKSWFFKGFEINICGLSEVYRYHRICHTMHPIHKL